MLANDASEKEARKEDAPKTTLPSSGERGGWAPPEAEATTAFTSSITWRSLKYASCGGILSSSTNRSSLLTKSITGSRCATAARIVRSVLSITPSTASTTTSAPSARRRPATTSSEKLTWPGVSIRLKR